MLVKKHIPFIPEPFDVEARKQAGLPEEWYKPIARELARELMLAKEQRQMESSHTSGISTAASEGPSAEQTAGSQPQ